MSTSWIDWAIENSVNGVREDQLIKVMLESKVEPTTALAIVSNIKRLPGYKLLERLSQKINKTESVLKNAQLLLEQNPEYTNIKRIKTPNKEDFLADYWSIGRPVVLADVANDWPAMQKWTIENIRDLYGDCVVQIQNGRDQDPEYEIRSASHREESTMRKFAERILSTESSNDFYMTANNYLCMKIPGILEDVGTLPEFINRPDNKGHWHFWMGPKGTLTPMHHDMNALIHVQILGRKKWKLISPFNTPEVYNHNHVFSKVDLFNIDYAAFPLMKNVQIIEVVVNPGDALFLPLGWWHSVESLDRSISISITDTKYPNNWKYKNPRVIR